jgi:orotate phosphoribosyltransferase
MHGLDRTAGRQGASEMESEEGGLSMDQLSATLFDIGCIKFGEFKLKSGITSPVYVDFRGVISHPEVLRKVARAMAGRLRELELDRVAGIPYAGLPIGVAVALEGDFPMIYPRKEAKDYGTGKLIEGKFERGDRVVVLDDVITDGASKIEAIRPLEDAGLVVKDVLIILDREQGGVKILAEQGYRLHSLMTLSGVLEALRAAGKVGPEMVEKVRKFIAEHQFGQGPAQTKEGA